MDVFKLDTPSDISEMSESEIISLCNSYGDIKSAKTRAKLVKLIYKDILKFDLSKDLFYVLVDETKEVLVLAPAGGGKTTTMSVKACLEKLYRKSKFTMSGKVKGDRILCLVYTKDNVKDVIDRHTELVSKLNALEIEQLTIDYDLNCSTMHSFCYKWVVKEPNYAIKLGISGFKMFDDVSQMSSIETLVGKICEKRQIELPRQFKASSFLSLYNYMAETYKTLTDLESSNMVLDLGLPIDVIEELIMRYEKRKKLIRKLDQTDLLTNFLKLMRTDEEARKRIQEYYDYIIADEVQDFTPILKDILKSIVGEHTVLSCIGDDDQAIYGFRGADYRNTLDFKSIFPDSKVMSLSTNRRCPSNVLSMANSVIRLNKSRYDKVMTGLKGPGRISFNAYNDRIGQYMSIVSLVKDLDSDERNNTIIGSRENLFSLPLSILMYKANLDFYTSKGYGPFDYGLFTSITKVMSAITSGGSKVALLNLYRVLPISKKEMCDALKYNPDKQEFLDGKSYVDFDKIEFSQARLSNPKFVSIYKNLIHLHRNVDTLPCKDYMPGLIHVIKKHYWNFMSQNLKMPPEIMEFCEDFYGELFNTSKTYKEKLAEILEFKQRMSNNLKNRRGVMLSAFHSMKGLESDNIILCDLAESIFPNFSGIDFRPYDEQTKVDLKEEETRLCYVALTRTKKNLWLFYSKNDPSYYITFLMDSAKENAEKSSSVYSDSEPTPTLGRFTVSNLFSEDSTFDMSKSEVESPSMNKSAMSKSEMESPSMNNSEPSSNNPSMNNTNSPSTNNPSMDSPSNHKALDEMEEIEIEMEANVESSTHSNESDSVIYSPSEEATYSLNEATYSTSDSTPSDSTPSDNEHTLIIKDSVDKEFIESGDISIRKEHDLDGISVVAKSVKNSYRSNVFKSVFNKNK